MIQLPEADALRQAADGTIGHALNLAVLFLGVAAGKLRFDGDAINGEDARRAVV